MGMTSVTWFSTGVYATAANVRYLRAEVAQTRHTLVLPIAG
jgi:hypothetical protein